MAIISIKDKYDANKVYVVKATDLAPLVSADGLTSYGVTVDALLKIERDRAEAVEAQLLLTTGGNVTGKYNFGDPGNEDGFIKVNGVDTDAQVKINTFDDVYTSEFIIHRHSTSDPGNIVFSRSKSTDAAHGNVVDGDVTGEVVYSGWNTNSYWKTAMVNSAVDGTPASGDMPGRLNFHTTPAGSAVPALAFSLRSNKKAEFAGDVEITGDLTGTINAAGRVSALYNDTVSSSLYCYNSNTANFAVSGQFVASAASLGSYAVQASGAGSNSRVIYSSATGANSVAVQGYNSNASGVGVKGDAGVNAGALGGRFSNTITTSDHLEVAAETNFLVGYKTAVEQFRITNAGAGLFIGGVDKLTTATGAVSVAASAAPTAGHVLTAVTATTATWQASTGSPGGSASQLQYNNAGGFGGVTGLTYNGTNQLGYTSDYIQGFTITNTSAIANSDALRVSGGTTATNTNSIYGLNSSIGGTAIRASIGSSANNAFYGIAISASGVAGRFYNSALTGNAYGVSAQSDSATGAAIYAYGSHATGANKGVHGLSGSSTGWGVFAENIDGTDTEVYLAGGTTLILGSLDGVEKFKVTDAGALSCVVATFPTEVANTGTTQTVNWNSGQKQKTTITAATGMTFTAPPGPCNLTLKIVNGGTGVITWPASVTWPAGTEPTWTTTGTDIASFYYDGTNYHGMAGLAFA